MSAIYIHSLNQLITIKRVVFLIIALLLPLAPLLIANRSLDISFVTLIMTLFVVPVLSLILAPAVFGDEVDNKTLFYLTTSPTARWKIVLAKWGAVLTVGSTFILGATALLTGIANIYFEIALGPTMLSIVVGSLAAMLTLTALMTWVGLKFDRPFVVSIMYLLVWELGLEVVQILGGGGSGSSGRSGLEYITVGGYAENIIDSIQPVPLEAPPNLLIAIVGVVVLTIVFLALSERRLRTMEIP